MIQTTELQKFNALLATYKAQTNSAFNFHRQKELTNLIAQLEKQTNKAQKEMQSALLPIKKEVLQLHRHYLKEAQKMGLVDATPRKERTNDSGYRFAYYKEYLQVLQHVGNNKKFTLNSFRELVKDGQKEHQHKNRLLNMAKDNHIRKLDEEGNLFCTLIENPERCASNNHVR